MWAIQWLQLPLNDSFFFFNQSERQIAFPWLAPFEPWRGCNYLSLPTCRSVAGAGGHRGRLEDDGVTAGGQPNCHLLVEDPAWSLQEVRRRGGDLSQLQGIFMLAICVRSSAPKLVFWDNSDPPYTDCAAFGFVAVEKPALNYFCIKGTAYLLCSWRNSNTTSKTGSLNLRLTGNWSV